MKTNPIALIHTSPQSAISQIAGLPILDRLAILASRSGCHEIHISFPHPNLHRPTLKRAETWNIKIHWHHESFPPHLRSQPHLHLTSDWLPSKDDLASLISTGLETHQTIHLTTASGSPTPIHFVPLPSPNSPTTAPPSHASRPSQGICCPVRTDAERHSATQALWSSIKSSSDGFVDVWFNRPLGRLLLSKWLIHTPFTPNQISAGSILIGVYGAWCLARGNTDAAIWGALWFQCSAMVDCVDGDVARMVYKETSLGKWLDLAGDQVVHIGVFAGIALGLHRMGTTAPVMALGISTILGALISFLVVLRSILRPQNNSSRLQKLIDGATSRDFSVLVLFLACIGHLEWFLWMSAIGSHVFWILALSLQATSRNPAPLTPSGAPPVSPSGGSR